jgi:hypothetical protein
MNPVPRLSNDLNSDGCDKFLRGGLQARHPHLHILTGTKLPPVEFVQALKDAKLFVSPFGLGEFSGKDYEAV